MNEVRGQAHFDGKFCDIPKDHLRLSRQFERVRDYMSDHQFHSVQEVAQALNIPENSASAQIRNLRKARFGARVIETQRCTDTGLFKYRMKPLPPTPKIDWGKRTIGPLEPRGPLQTDFFEESGGKYLMRGDRVTPE